MAFKNYLDDWRLSLEEFESGGYGSSTRTFRVPKMYEEYYTTINEENQKVYQKQLAFKEIAIVLCNAVYHRFAYLFSKVDLFETALNIGTNLQEIKQGDASFKFKLTTNYTIPPQVNEVIYFGNNLTLSTAITKSVTLDKSDTKGLTYIIETVQPIELDYPASSNVYITNKLMFVYMPSTINFVKAAIYKGIQYASLNREFWQITKDSSFTGASWSFSNQTSTRILTNDIFGIEANALLENALLDKYEIYETDNGNKHMYFDNKLLYSSSVFDINQHFIFSVLYDDSELVKAEGGFSE